MSDKDNIISLEERLRRKAGEGAKESEQAQDSGEVEAWEPLPGKLVWLHCPVCETLEYTEVVMAGGRSHNLCGNQVEEVELEIDLRAENTIAKLNLERLQMLAEAVEIQKARFEEYQHRLRLIASGDVGIYKITPETFETLPVAELDPMGLIVSRALHNPSRHFLLGEEAPAESGESAEKDAPPKAENPAKGEMPLKPGAKPDFQPPKP